MTVSTGATLWLTGLPSAGKSTIARGVADWLNDRGRPTEILDGDEIRARLSRGLGFSKEDRNENVLRIGWLAHMLARHGVIVLVPVIAPYAEARAEVRRRHAESGICFGEIFVSTPVEVCAERDVKGLYASQARGELSGLTGVDDPYEPPDDPELRLDTSGLSLGASVAAVAEWLAARGLA